MKRKMGDGDEEIIAHREFMSSQTVREKGYRGSSFMVSLSMCVLWYVPVCTMQICLHCKIIIYIYNFSFDTWMDE